MAIDSPTFSESWYRVAGVRARLRAGVQVRRQRFRGQTWHVARDPANNKFFRLHPAAYHFMGLLDGRRTVAEAWRITNDRLGDEAVTQNEAIEVLGRLYGANLLAADLPADAEGLFQRYRRRRVRELRGRLANLLAVRIPLFDPDAPLDRVAALAGWAFSPAGFLLWLVVVAAGAAVAASRWGELLDEGRRMMDLGELARGAPLLYAAFLLAKAVHELAHGVACKRFGRRAGGGEVHEMGIMLLVFAPMPYVDATSAWALRSKLHRVVVGAAGMMAELALAAAAAAVWTATAGADSPAARAVHAVAYGTVFIASVSTVAFNANPLLRFDGYYILSDLLEIPNLAERSRAYVAWLVKRWAWGVRSAGSPAAGGAEAAWLAVYAAASTAFRVWICVAVLLVLCERLLAVGVVLAAAAIVAWVLVPLGRLVRYLLTGAELDRSRGRALATSALAAGAVVVAVGLVPAGDRWTVEGTVHPSRLAHVHAATAGFVRAVLPSGTAVDLPTAQDAQQAGGEAGAAVLAARSRELEVELAGLACEKEALAARQRAVRQLAGVDRRYLAVGQVIDKDLEDLRRQEELVRRELAGLAVRAPQRGTWLCPRAERMQGAYVARGEEVGVVASMDELVVRARPSQRLAGMLRAEGAAEVELRAIGADEDVRGTWRLLPGEQPKGGQRTDAPGEPAPLLEARAAPGAKWAVLPGQRVRMGFRLPPRALAAQWWRSVRQVALERFGL